MNVLRTMALVASHNLRIGGGGYVNTMQNGHTVSLLFTLLGHSSPNENLNFGGSPQKGGFYDHLTEKLIYHCGRHPQNRGCIGCYFLLGR